MERYHRFLNKTQAIAGTDRGTHSAILQNAKTSQYAWNSAPIDNTDIARSKAAIGREFRFPLDVELSPTPNFNNVHNSALFAYLRNVSTDSDFAVSVLQILIQERRDTHRDRHNSDKRLCDLKIGDVVKAHVQVNSVASKGVVGKLSYRAKGPFVITKDLGHNSFEVQSYDDPSSSNRKYKNTKLYLLPPALFLSHPLDTIDQRYLDSTHAPIVNPLKKSMKIDLYNDKWLSVPNTSTPTHSTIVNKPFSELNSLAFPPHPDTQFLSTSDLHVDTQNSDHMQREELAPPVRRCHTRRINTHPSHPPSLVSPPVCLHDELILLKDKLCFVQYTPGTMSLRWYLIQIDMASSHSLDATC